MSELPKNDFLTPRERVLQAIEMAATRYERDSIEFETAELKDIRDNKAVAVADCRGMVEVNWEAFVQEDTISQTKFTDFMEFAAARLEKGVWDDPDNQNLKTIRKYQAEAVRETSQDIVSQWDWLMRETKTAP